MLTFFKPERLLLSLFYMLLCTGLHAQNLLVNGDFESGGAGTGFQTNYFIASTPGTSNPRQYNILTNPFTMNNAFFSNTVDHTFGDGTGRMMVVDGSGNANHKVWELVNGGSIGVISGRTYIFSYWIRSISASNTSANSAIIKVYTNGTTSAPVLIAGSQTCPTGSPSPWVQVSYRWTATTSNAQIWLTDEQTNGGGAGNDFALDDLTLVEDRGPLAIRFHPSDPSCPDVTTGGIFVQGTGGTPPYRYSLNGGAFQNSGYFSVPVSTGNQVRVVDSKIPVPDTVSSLPANISVNAALNPLVLTPGDQSICNSATLQLNASGGVSGYTWMASTAPGVANLSATNIANPTAAPTATTTYTVTSQAPGANLVANPQFELGDSLFYTDYKFYISTTNQKAYGISVNAQLFGASFSACTDFNNPGTGRMMVVDGSTTANDKVWCQQIAVTPNTSYTFSYRLQTLALPNPAQIETLINGVSVGIVTAPSTVCSWTQVSYVWNSGASTSANICLYDRVLAPIGNDFALDDIFFTTVCTISKSLTITVGSLAAPVVSTPVQPSCTAPTGSFTVSAPLGIQYEYSINGTSYQAGSTFSGLAPGTYQVTVKDINSNCVSAATAVTINNVPALPAAPAIGTPTQPTCTVPTGSFTITAPLGANLSYNINGGAYQAGISFSGLAPNSYAVTVRDNNTGCVSAATNITINAVPGAPAAPTVGIPTQPTCTVPTGSFTVTAPLGANLSYNINGGTYQSGTSFSGLAPNSYAVTVRDNNTGCVSAATNITINAVPGAPATPTIGTPTQPTCTVPTGSFTITAPLGANLSYNINGGIYQAGTTFSGLAPNTYAVTVRDNNTGCVSAATNITINAVPGAPAAPALSTPTQPTCTVLTGSFTVTAPLGANLSYNINGGTYQAGTTFSGLAPNTYAVTVRDNNTGCVSAATNIAINAVPGAPAAPTMGTPTQPTCTVPTGSFTITAPLGANLSYNINGGIYQAGTTFSGLAPNTYAVTVRDNNTGCVSAATNITINAAPAAPPVPVLSVVQPTCSAATAQINVLSPAGVEYSFDNGLSFQLSNSFTAQPGNTYQVLVRNAAGCLSASVPAIINPAPSRPPAPQLSLQQPTCTVPTGIITVTAPAAGVEYSFDNGVSFQAGNVSLPLTGGATYPVRVRNAAGCVSDATQAVLIPQPATPPAPQVTGTVNYCQGASAVALTATGTSLLWYTGAAGGTGSAVAPVPATSTAGSVPYYVSQTLNGCEGPRAVITVQVSAAPPLPSVSSPVSYCQGVTASPLSPVAAGLLWYTAPVGGIGVSSLTPSTSLPGSFAYYVSETVNGCEGPRAAVQVQVNPAPALGADREAGICAGGFYNLAVLYANTGVPVNFELNGAPVARPDSLTLSGTYEVVADGGNGCRDTALVNLQVQPPVVASAGNDSIAVLGQPFQLVGTGGGAGGNYRWTDLGPSFTAQFSDPFIANPTVILRDPVDSLRVDVTDRWGCRGSAIVRITVLAGPAFYVPTAFSPNGDGLNDIFRPIPVGFGKLRYFRIFNRFGELVFESSRYLDGWDGRYKGKAQQPGNYVWVLQAEGRNGGLVERKGNVVLVR